MRYAFIAISVYSIILISCHDETTVQPCYDPRDPECIGYNPCLDTKPADAYFRIVDSIYKFNCNDSLGPITYVANFDTTWNDRYIYFKVRSSALQHYFWKIGTDPNIYTEKQVSLFFDKNFTGTIQIELITTVDDTMECLSPDQRSDTSKQKLTFISIENGTTYLNGKYKGTDSNFPLDTFTIEIPNSVWVNGLVNFPNNCSDKVIPISLGSRVFFILPSTEVCGSPCGRGILKSDRKTILIDYSVEDGNGARSMRQFIGIRTQ